MSYQDSSSNNDFTKVSKINSAGLINLRLHNLWVDVNKHARGGKFALWNADLDRIWCELAGDERKKEDDENNSYKIMDNFNVAIAKVNPLVNWKATEGFESIDVDQEKKKSLQNKALLDKELFLRRLFNVQGKGTAYQESVEDYMDG